MDVPESPEVKIKTIFDSLAMQVSDTILMCTMAISHETDEAKEGGTEAHLGCLLGATVVLASTAQAFATMALGAVTSELGEDRASRIQERMKAYHIGASLNFWAEWIDGNPGIVPRPGVSLEDAQDQFLTQLMENFVLALWEND